MGVIVNLDRAQNPKFSGSTISKGFVLMNSAEGKSDLQENVDERRRRSYCWIIS